MEQQGEADTWWKAAFGHILDDEDGAAIRKSQGLWARAVRAELADARDIACAGDVFGPALTPGGFVVTRPLVAVRTDDPQRTRQACDSAWRRFALVDDDGVEVDQERLPGVPDPFGYAVADETQVVLGFDGREDEEPYPHRGRTCLRILVEELRRHGCVPAAVVNPLHLPDDDGVDIDTLADQAEPDKVVGREAAPRVAPTSSLRARTTGGRPAWLPDFHRVTRTRTASPSGPVPFVLIAARWAWAWDPDAGLFKLPDLAPEEPDNVSVPMEALTPDGTRIHYYRLRDFGPTKPPAGFVTYDIVTGTTEVETARTAQIFEAGPGGPYLYYRTPERTGDWTLVGASYDLVEAPGLPPRALPLGGFLIGNDNGAEAQFSPSGRRLLTSHHRPNPAGGDRYVLCSDLVIGQHREFADLRLAGSASWSPDETRCLVHAGNQPYVLDLVAGARTVVLTSRLNSQPADRRTEVRPLGWLGNDGLLVSQSYGKRIELAYQPLDNSARYPVLDIPVPGRAGDVLGVVLAADVIHRSPGSVGLRGRDARAQ